MGGCQINFTVSCFIRGKKTDLGLEDGLQLSSCLPRRWAWTSQAPTETLPHLILCTTWAQQGSMSTLRHCGAWAVWFRTMTRKQPCSSSSPLPADVVSLRARSPLTASSPFAVFSQGQAVPSIWIWGPGTPWLAGECFLPSTAPVFSFMVLIRGDVVILLLGAQLYVELQGFIRTGMYTADAQDWMPPK